MWVRDLGHRAALFRIICFPWVLGSSFPKAPTPSSSSLFHSPSSSLAGPYAHNLRLISSSAGQSTPTLSLGTLLLWACVHEKWQRGGFRGVLTSRGAGEKMKGRQRNPVSSSCYCSGVARSDSKISAKALYGKWLHQRGVALFFSGVLRCWLVFKPLPLHAGNL